MSFAYDGLSAAAAAAGAGAHAESFLLLLGAGLLIGLYHALEPDHVAAVSTAITGRRQGVGPGGKWKRVRRAGVGGAAYGMMWGFGHTSAVFLVAVAVFVLAVEIPQHVFGALEVAVGAMLIILGASALANGAVPVLSRLRLHSHSHPHEHADGTVHSHPHAHNGSRTESARHRHGHRSYVIGCIHGMAGSGGLVVLAASHMMAGAQPAIDGAPLLFASVFGAGSIIGMSAVAGLLSLILVARGMADGTRRILQYGSGAGAATLGAYIMAAGIMSAVSGTG